MDILRISSIGIITAFCVMILRETKSEIAVFVGLAGGVVILLMLLDYFTGIFNMIKDLTQKAGIDSQLLSLLMKIVGIGYISEFSAGIIEDAGLKSLSDKVILGGKLIILGLSLPIILKLFEIVSAMIA